MKKRATEQTVYAFLAALYPDATELAIAAFDEETVLAFATKQIKELNQLKREMRGDPQTSGAAFLPRDG